MQRLTEIFAMVAIGLLVFPALALALDRVVGAHLTDENDGTSTAVGVVKFRDAMLDQEYTAMMTIKENGVDLAMRTITLLVGVDRVTESDAFSSIDLRRKTTRQGVQVIVARIRVFDVSGLSSDLYKFIGALDEASINVVRGEATVPFL